MWKIVVGFILFAALSMFVIMKGGDNLDMSGEKHGGEHHEEPKKVDDAAAVPPAAPAAPAVASANAILCAISLNPPQNGLRRSRLGLGWLRRDTSDRRVPRGWRR